MAVIIVVISTTIAIAIRSGIVIVIIILIIIGYVYLGWIWDNNQITIEGNTSSLWHVCLQGVRRRRRGSRTTLNYQTLLLCRFLL